MMLAANWVGISIGGGMMLIALVIFASGPVLRGLSSLRLPTVSPTAAKVDKDVVVDNDERPSEQTLAYVRSICSTPGSTAEEQVEALFKGCSKAEFMENLLSKKSATKTT